MGAPKYRLLHVGCQLHFDLCQWRSNGRDECKHWRLGCPKPARGRIGDVDCPNHRWELYWLVAFSQRLWRSVRRDRRCGDYCRRGCNRNVRTYGYACIYGDRYSDYADLCSDCYSNLGSHICPNLSSYVCSHICPNLSSNLGSHICPNLSSDLGSNVCPNLSSNLGSNSCSYFIVKMTVILEVIFALQFIKRVRRNFLRTLAFTVI